MSYRTIDPRMWDDAKFKALARPTREVWFYLLTGPHVTMLPGIQRTSAAIVADGLDLPVVEVRAAFAELEAAGLACVDTESKVVRLPNAPRYNEPANSKVVKGWFNLWETLPESPLKYAHLASLHAALPDSEWAGAAWAKDFGRVKIPNRFRIGSESVPVPESQDSESIPLPEPETKSGSHDLDLSLNLTGLVDAAAPTVPVPKASTGKRPKPPDPPTGEAGPDRDAYLAKFRTLFGSPNADFTKGQTLQFWTLRKKFGIAVLLASLEGLASDRFNHRARTLGFCVTTDAVELGTRSAPATAPPLVASRVPERPPVMADPPKTLGPAGSAESAAQFRGLAAAMRAP